MTLLIFFFFVVFGSPRPRNLTLSVGLQEGQTKTLFDQQIKKRNSTYFKNRKLTLTAVFFYFEISGNNNSRKHTFPTEKKKQKKTFESQF